MNREQRVLAWTRPAVRGLKPYYKAPVEGDPLRLDQNTNLYGPNPVLADVDPAAEAYDQYPSRDADGLRAAMADMHGLAADRFVCGNGSDELLDLLSKAFAAPGQTMAVTAPSYSLYPFYATLQDLRLVRVPLRGGWRLDVDAILEASAALTVIASPNNPTGNRFPRGELERLVEQSDGVVVVDEAYIEYAGLENALLARVDAYDNLVVTRTFSKAYGLAGLRIGVLAANADLAGRLRLVKPPFNLNRYAERVAVAALARQDWVEDVVQQTTVERDRLTARLKDLGFRVHPSDANFLLTEPPEDPGILLAALRERSILARTFPDVPGLEACLRFTVGRPADSERLLSALGDILP